MTHSLGTQIRQDCALDSLARQGCWFCSADGESDEMCPLSTCCWKQGCWVGSTASSVLWLGPQVGQVEAAFIGEWGLGRMGALTPSLARLFGVLAQTTPYLKFLGFTETGVALWSISSACCSPCLLLGYPASSVLARLCGGKGLGVAGALTHHFPAWVGADQAPGLTRLII